MPEIPTVNPEPTPEPTPRPKSIPATPLEPEMILIPAGRFLMGSDPQEDPHARNDEQPQHTLYLPDYYIAKTPVTNAQYTAFITATGYRQPSGWDHSRPVPGKDNHPVVAISRHDARAYCQWLSEKAGRTYRLPTETEWEKVAGWDEKTGKHRIYPWGDSFDPEKCNTREAGPGTTTPVGQYSPDGDSPYGAADMAGNVWEWTRSLYEGYPYDPDDGREDLEAEGDRVLRGGS